MKKIIIVLFSVILTMSASAQEKRAQEDVLYLKGGHEFRGEITEYKPGESVKIKTWNGMELSFDAKKIKKIVQKNEDNVEKARKSYNFKEKGIFNSTDFSVNLGSNANNYYYYYGDKRTIVGLGLHNVTGYQINRFVGAGVGLGVEALDLGGQETFIPVYAQVRGYLLKKAVTPMYKMDFGYGFLLKNKDLNYEKQKGGLMLHPAVGFRFGAGATSCTLDFGYKFQKSKLSRNDDWGLYERNSKYKRYTIRLGLLF